MDRTDMDPAMAIEAAALVKREPILAATAQGDSEVQRFYKNSVVFLTGGSGFLGKQLIEKLFRSCQISKVYMLLRPKKGKDIQLRINDIFDDPLYDLLKEQKPDFMSKIKAVEGDVSDIRLGINDQDWKTLTEEVHVMYHLAATTRFDESLVRATLINVRGTREALLLGKACKNLRSYVQVSTAYTYATTLLAEQEVKEEFYEAPVLPEDMISMAEHMDPQRLVDITPSLIKDWPNTYTFTKAISEELVRDMSAGLPICIVRPGVVICSYREPVPGWLDTSCIFGATGFIFGLAIGLLHTCYTKLHKKLGLVPIDYVNNAIIVAARETAASQAKGGADTRIYTIPCPQKNPVDWALLEDVVRNARNQISSPRVIYYCFGGGTSSRLSYMTSVIFLQFLPAYIADFVSLLIGKPRRYVKLANKVYKMSDVLTFFLWNEWKFLDNNTEKLYKNLSNQDQTIFNFNTSDVAWNEYITIWCIGIRKYIIKDGLKDSVYAIQKQKYLRIIHYIVTALFIYCVWKLLSFVYYCFYQVFLS